MLGAGSERAVRLGGTEKSPAEMEQADSMSDLFTQLQLTTLPQEQHQLL